jgi:hypothetical protein
MKFTSTQKDLSRGLAFARSCLGKSSPVDATTHVAVTCDDGGIVQIRLDAIAEEELAKEADKKLDKPGVVS